MSASLHRKIPYVLMLLGVVGVAIGSYLTIAHWGKQPIVCGGVGDCNTVNSSEYASVAGLPVAGLGALLYLTMTLTAIAWAARRDVDWLPIAYWGLALAGAGYAAYLTYIELDVLHAICVWCVSSATILTVSLILGSIAVFVEPDETESEAVLRGKDGLKMRTAARGK